MEGGNCETTLKAVGTVIYSGICGVVTGIDLSALMRHFSAH